MTVSALVATSAEAVESPMATNLLQVHMPAAGSLAHQPSHPAACALM